MTETAPQAPTVPQTEVWHIDFHLSYEPQALASHYVNCQMAYRPQAPDPQPWIIDGIASFDAPSLIPPRDGADLIPYLIYHLDEVKAWLIEEHVRRVFNGQEEKIRPQACVANPYDPDNPPA